MPRYRVATLLIMYSKVAGRTSNASLFSCVGARELAVLRVSSAVERAKFSRCKCAADPYPCVPTELFLHIVPSDSHKLSWWNGGGEWAGWGWGWRGVGGLIQYLPATNGFQRLQKKCQGYRERPATWRSQHRVQCASVNGQLCLRRAG